jgi:predicted metalloprotease
MRLDRERISTNVEDRRGGSFVGRGMGIGGIVIALVAMYFGVDPALITGVVDQGQPPASSVPPANDPASQFIARILGSTEDVWNEAFRQAGSEYHEPTLVLFSGATPTACGTGQAAMGPFYCPRDQKVYIDLSFYEQLRSRLNAPGDFAQAYVIAHEVGHHVQHLLGTTERVQEAERAGNSRGAKSYSVRLELQADCYAGVWASRANEARQILEQGDVEEALNAASAIGDDALQKQSQGTVVPDSFTHGTSAQRVTWFRRGLETGDPMQCDTFAEKTL